MAWRSCGGSPSSRSSAARSTSPSHARTSWGRCWRARGRTAFPQTSGSGPLRPPSPSPTPPAPTSCGCTTRALCRRCGSPRRSITPGGALYSPQSRPKRPTPGVGVRSPAVAGGAWEPALGPAREDGRLVAESGEAATMAKLTGLPDSLDAELREALLAGGIESLYSHQAAAYETATTTNLSLTSGTASGKSLSFNLPVLDGIAAEPKRRAIYLYPTKALAQDQARKLGQLRPPGLREAIYDGDTPREDRPSIRRRANLVLTNP